MLEVLLVPVSPFVVTIYCIFYFFCYSFAIIYQKVQKFDITISVCIIYL